MKNGRHQNKCKQGFETLQNFLCKNLFNWVSCKTDAASASVDPVSIWCDDSCPRKLENQSHSLFGYSD